MIGAAAAFAAAALIRAEVMLPGNAPCRCF
jgi:hypothetical protein